MSYTYNYAPQFATNKNYVSGVEDAMSRYSSPNTVIAFFLQDDSGVVEITTDMYGKKYPNVRKFEKTETAQPSGYVTKDELKNLEAKVDSLMPKSKKAVKDNEAE